MKKPSLRSAAIVGLFFGLLLGIWIAAAVDDPASTAQPGSSSKTPETIGAEGTNSENAESDIAARPTWTFRGAVAHLDVPLDFGLDDKEVETDFGWRADFSSQDGQLIVETAPGFAETSMTLRELARRFADNKNSNVHERKVAELTVDIISWTERDRQNTQYFFTKDAMTYGLRTNAGSVSDQLALLDFLVESVERNEPSGAPTPTATPTPTPSNERPTDCVGKEAIPKTITNVEKFANTRDRPSPDAAVATPLALGTNVTWTGEKIKNGRFVWHEIYGPELDSCVWIAHGLIGESPDAGTPPVLSEPLVFGPSSIAGLPTGSSTERIVDRITAIAGPAIATSQVPADSFWGPGSARCPEYLVWDYFSISTCADGTASGWLADTNGPPEVQIDVGDGDGIIHWRRLASWPDDTTAWFNNSGEFWVVKSQSLGLAGVVDQGVKALYETYAPVVATDVLPSNTIIDQVWNSE